MRVFTGQIMQRCAGVGAIVAMALGLSTVSVQTQDRPTVASMADFLRAMDELSNWGRWGPDDELGAANLITPATRKAAAALVTDGISVSLAHDIPQSESSGTILERVAFNISPTGGFDRYAYTGTYHGTTHSHLDSLGCHIMWQGEGYNGQRMEDVEAAGACPRSHINVLKDGIFTRGILYDATLLPGKATPEGWLEPGTPITWADLEALEEIQGVRASEGDVILLYTGRWKRRAVMGNATGGVAGYHADVAYFLKERGVSFMGHDKSNDAQPHEIIDEVPFALHMLALVSLGVDILDNLDFERAIEVARRLNRYEFLFTTAPLRIEGGMGSPVNPIATF